jgi:hypothetical protein
VHWFEANTDLIPLLKSDRDYIQTSGWMAGFSVMIIDGYFLWNLLIINKLYRKPIISEEIPDLSSINIMSLEVEAGELNVLKGLDN